MCTFEEAQADAAGATLGRKACQDHRRGHGRRKWHRKPENPGHRSADLPKTTSFGRTGMRAKPPSTRQAILPSWQVNRALGRLVILTSSSALVRG